ncbi:serine hydrolase [Xanthobacter versatilis]|uniref:serine hydrolase n=1 Tax=Xanthobacter autotrophicus (strain ATCC BAA-1158 / Py2) TaxID=78245 RepID=UPI00372A6342
MTQVQNAQYAVAVVSRLFEEREIAHDTFAPALRVPDILRRVAQARDELIERFGPLQSVVPSAKGAMLLFRAASIPARISFDTDGRVGGLYFETPRHEPLDRSAALSLFNSKPGRKAIYVQRDGSEWLSYNQDVPLAVGSAFKLLVYEEVLRRVRNGSLAWTDIAHITQCSASFGGIFDRWPIETGLTLSSLCNAMIAASDNTSTDVLIDLLGRSTLERLSPRNRPFLKTREMFLLKFGLGRHLARRFLDGQIRSKRRILRAMTDWPVHEQPTGFDPAPGIEWFFTARELVQLIERVHTGQAFQVSGGPFDGEYETVSFKAGREPGVINYTLRAEHSGVVVTCSATWNNDGGVDEDDFAEIVKGTVAGCFGYRLGL